MTAHDTITDRLSDYLDDDGELSARERADIEAHLATCVECRQICDDLRAIAAAAGRLHDDAPDRDLWTGVAARITAAGSPAVAFERKQPRRFSFTLPQLAAAGIALMVLSGSMVYMARSGENGADFPAISADPGGGADAIVPVSLADPQYDSAIADLEQALEEGRARLDPETIKVLEQNLASIDLAIEQCRRALDADPANAFLTSHLASARQRKLALLRRATALTAGS
jgi:anti-sigma factor RsiW